jgi:hypothetical protein
MEAIASKFMILCSKILLLTLSTLEAKFLEAIASMRSSLGA